MLLHIHGFNSSPASNTFRMLREFFPKAKALAYPCDGCFADNLTALRQQATALYQQALEQTLRQALGEHTVDIQAATSAAQAAALGNAPSIPLVISGSSLGGFYASQLAALLHAEQAIAAPCHCVLFNPVVYPAEALRPFLGCNTLFHSGVEWEFTPAMLESYTHFADTREHGDADAKDSEDKQACAKGRRRSDGGSYAQGNTARSKKPALRRFVLLGRNDSLLNPAEARAYWQYCAQIHETDDEHSIAALDAATVAALRDLGAGA